MSTFDAFDQVNKKKNTSNHFDSLGIIIQIYIYI